MAANQAITRDEQEKKKLKERETSRNLGHLFTKTFIIAHLMPFTLADSKDVKMFLTVAGKSGFPQLHPLLIRHHVAELYSATVKGLSCRLIGAIKEAAGGPLFHANFEIWRRKMSSEKYIGLRLFWMSPSWVFSSALLAVKPYRPPPNLKGVDLSNALLLWVKEVLAEYGLRTSHVFSTVTDVGAGIERPWLKMVDSAWEWCFPNMLNGALIEVKRDIEHGLFVETPRAESSTAFSAEEPRYVLDIVKNLFDHVNKSPQWKVKIDDISTSLFTKSTKLINAVPQSWISARGMLEEILLNWPSLEQHFTVNEPMDFPFAAYKTLIEELYSLIKPVADLIQTCQKARVLSGVWSYLDLVALRTRVLSSFQPLLIQSPKPAHASETGSNTDMPRTGIMREHKALADVTKETRQMIAMAIDNRFFARRYARVDGKSTDFLFEMAASMNPVLAQLSFLGAVCTSANLVVLRETVREKIVDMMVSMADATNKHTAGGRNGDVITVGMAHAAKKQRVGSDAEGSSISQCERLEEAQNWLESGMFTTEPKSTRQVCEDEFDAFLAMGANETIATSPLSLTVAYWGGQGSRQYPNMSRAARVLLSVPASSAVLEKDFSSTGRLGTRSSSRLDVAYSEMVLFLHGSKEFIPEDVPVLSAVQAEKAVPSRLLDPCDEVTKISGGIEGPSSEVTDEFSNY